jgi:hypothetical protein
MRMLRLSRSWLRRLATVATTAVVLLTAALAHAEAQPTGTSKDAPAGPASKNYSIPWVATIMGLAAIIVPVAMASRRKWEMPFEDEEDEK